MVTKRSIETMTTLMIRLHNVMTQDYNPYFLTTLKRNPDSRLVQQTKRQSEMPCF